MVHLINSFSCWKWMMAGKRNWRRRLHLLMIDYPACCYFDLHFEFNGPDFVIYYICSIDSSCILNLLLKSFLGSNALLGTFPSFKSRLAATTINFIDSEWVRTLYGFLYHAQIQHLQSY